MNRILAREILRCFLPSGKRKGSPAHGRAYGRREWERALVWLDSSGLALYFWQRQKEAGTDHVLPPEVSSRLARNLADNQARVARMAEESERLNRLFEEGGVKYALLKGFAMIPDYCPDASLRSQYDHDYLLSPASRGRAHQALRAAGYERKNRNEKHPAVYFEPSPPTLSPSSRDDLYSERLPSSVELHFRLWEAEQEKIGFAPPEDALSRACLRNLEGRRFFALADEDALTLQVLHTFRHILNNWCRLSLFYEIAHLFEQRSSDRILWERFEQRIIDRPGLPLAAGVVFSLVADLFGAEIPAAVACWTVQALTPSLALWVQRYGRDSALENFCCNKFSLFLHREFIQDLSSWRVVRRRRLFPFHASHRLAPASIQPFSSRPGAAWRQRVYALGRLKFHLGSALRYAWELPRWERLVGRQAAMVAPREAGRCAAGEKGL